METHSVNRLEALGLIVGSALALACFVLEPGGPLIDRADPGDATVRITALASNAGIAHVSAIGVALGLVLMLYGLVGVTRVVRQDTTVGALARLGLLGMALGGFGWVLASGLNLVMAQTDLASASEMQAAEALFQADLGITIVCGMTVAGGFVAFSLGVATMSPRGPHKVAALVIAAVSLLCLAALVIGHTGQDATMISVARACYVPWTIWTMVLGAAFLRGSDLARAIEQGEPA